MTMSDLLDTYKELSNVKGDLIDQYKQRVELLEDQNQLLKRHLARVAPEYFKDLFGYYYDDVEDIRKKIAEAGD